MAKVLQNFLIGVGLDTEDYDDGAKRVEGSLGRMRTLVGFTGTAFVGAMAAAGSSAIAAGRRVDNFNLSVEKLNTSPAFIRDYGHAVSAMGGNFDEAAAAINSAEAALAQFRTKGTFGPFEDAAFAGVDTRPLTEAETGADFLRELAAVVPDLNKDQQRLIQDAWNLSDAVMRSLRGGLAEFDASIARAGELAGEFGRATDAARDYGRAISELNTRFENIGDTLAANILPSFTGVVDSLGGFIDRNRDLIDRTTKEKPEASALVGTSAAAIGVGAAASTIGLRGIGGLAMRGGVAGMAIGSGLIAADMRPDDIESITGYRPNDYIFDSTPLDAARDAYNAVADKFGFERSEKGSGAISYLEGGYGRVSDQISGFESYLNDYANPRAGGQPIEITESPTSGFVTPYDPVYSGGEVSNVEAAQANPDVTMVRDQRRQAEQPPVTPRIRVDNHLEANFTLDGRALESKMTDVIERRERDVMDDVTSSVNR
ncbi:hypothetical protein [Neopusillimonas maritima]|uniref:Uncharacterized protein n=1 Tax=Neopusillimonas maritima TaxID=2026239 RepID=A0A3A1Z0R9_9BURK|nr:hypothetical protein [Neopusillimonas maritima]RIY41947.1 hypothetical protein CJP73_00425 [Neopusillimonas maritima]